MESTMPMRYPLVRLIVLMALLGSALWAPPCLALTTKTVNPGGGADYTSLNAAWASLPDPLDDDYKITCSGSTDDTTAANLDARDPNGHTVVIEGNNTTGKADESKYQLHYTSASQGIFIQSDNVTLRYVEVIGSSSGYNGICLLNADSVLVEKNIVHGCTQSGYAGIWVDAGTGKTVYNNVCYGNNIGIRDYQTSGTIIHNTLVGNAAYGFQFDGTGTVTFKNNLLSGNTTADYYDAPGGSTATTACNYTSDTSSPDGAGYRSKTFTFVNAGSGDYHLDSGEDGNYNCTAAGPSDDVDGETRIHSDAGFDELIFVSTITFYSGLEGQLVVSLTYQSGTGSCGRFVCPNDWWAADSAGGYVTITALSPSPSDPCYVCCDLDPIGGYGGATALQGMVPTAAYNTGYFVPYSADEDIIDEFVTGDAGTYPQIAAGHTAVFVTSRTHKGASYWEPVKKFCLLTVLAAAPSPATDGYWFRPYWGDSSTKVPEYNTADIDFDVFADLTATKSTHTFAYYEALFCRTIFDWQWNTILQATHAYDAPIDTYGGWLAKATTGALLKLCEQADDSAKLTLAKYYLQFGLDTSRQIVDRGEKGPVPVRHYEFTAGGFYVGRLLPFLAVARAFNDAKTIAAAPYAGAPYISSYPYTSENTQFFGETYQCLKVRAEDIRSPPHNYTVGDTFFYVYPGYFTGKATFTHDSNEVVGSGTTWVAGHEGQMIMCRPPTHPSSFTDGYEMDKFDGRAYTIDSVEDTTHLILDRPWLGTTLANTFYGISSFVGIGACNYNWGGADYNELTDNLIGAPIFYQGGRAEWYFVTPHFTEPYEGIACAGSYGMITAILGIGAEVLGDFNDLLDYYDSHAYQRRNISEDDWYYSDPWFREVYNTHRSSFGRAVFDPLSANAGADRTIGPGQASTLRLDGSLSRNWILNSSSTTYVWTENGETVATGKNPDPLALNSGVHTFTLTVTDVTNDDERTDEVVITVSDTQYFLGQKP